MTFRKEHKLFIKKENLIEFKKYLISAHCREKKSV